MHCFRVHEIATVFLVLMLHDGEALSRSRLGLASENPCSFRYFATVHEFWIRWAFGFVI